MWKFQFDQKNIDMGPLQSQALPNYANRVEKNARVQNGLLLALEVGLNATNQYTMVFSKGCHKVRDQVGEIKIKRKFKNHIFSVSSSYTKYTSFCFYPKQLFTFKTTHPKIGSLKYQSNTLYIKITSEIEPHVNFGTEAFYCVLRSYNTV